jgi:flagellar hook-associated protein 3 FlgL
MLGRVTSQQLLVGGQRSIAGAKAQLAALQNQASSGRAITKPSDDPTGAAAALQVRSQQRANTQYGVNVDDGLSWLSTVDTTLTSSENVLRKAIDLTIQGANAGTMTATTRQALAQQLDDARTDLLAQANTKYVGRSVLAGNSDAPAAFDASYNYRGTPGDTVQRRIGAREMVAVSGDGAAAYGTGSTSVFATIDAVSTALRGGDDAGVRSGLDALRGNLATMSAEHAVVGGRYARLQQAKTTNASTTVALETQRSGIEDADIAKVMIDLKTQETNYQTALAVAAQTIQPTLMSFLR